ncbi:MAG: hypothetical protein EAX95_06865 [Candidatus Thorarchaeota archaeon]|nr:hypothetical protein [Candidatus Thorarchaeota archaeon]
MSEGNGEHNPKPPEPKNEPKRKPFNPMVTYIYVAAAIFITYSIFYTFGYPALIVSMLILIVYLFRETQFIRRRYSVSFIRKAAYINMGHAFIYFVLLAINGFWVLQYGEIVLLREIPFLTQWAPLFVCLGVFGITNIKQMYMPDR